jgi:hypothetical protein
VNAGLNTPRAATANPAPDDRLARVLTLVSDYIRENGAGKYVLIVRPDGSATVQRPRKPLESEFR